MSSTIFRSVLWTGLERFGAHAFQAIFTLVLARLLLPSDYGLVAMIFIFLMIGQMLMDGGLSLALVQKKNPTRSDFSTVFWFNLLFGVFFYVVFICCSPLIARFYEQPLLLPMIKVAGLNMIVWAFGLVHATRLEIALDFKKRAFITILAMILSGFLGVILAYYGFGAWALIIQFLANSTFRTLFFWLFGAKWHPRMEFSCKSLRLLLKFGNGFMLSGLLDTLFKNMYAVFIGKRYTITELGYFQQGYSLSNLITTNVAYTVSDSFIPLYTKLHDQPGEQRRIFWKYLSLGCFITFPLAIGFAVLAEPFVLVVMTDKWLPAVPFIQLLCLSYFCYPILVIYRKLLLATGFSRSHLGIEIISKVFGLIALFVCLPRGIGWICFSIGTYTVFDTMISLFFVKKILHIRLIEAWKTIWKTLGLALFSGVSAGLLSSLFDQAFLKLLFGTLLGVSVYLTGSCLLALDEWKFFLKFLKGTSRA